MISSSIIAGFVIFGMVEADSGNDAPPTPPELVKIQSEYTQRLRQPAGQTRAAIQKQREDAIKNWIKDLEAQQSLDHVPPGDSGLGSSADPPPSEPFADGG